MIILHDPRTLRHETTEVLGAKLIPSLECPARIHAIVEHLSKTRHTITIVDAGEGNITKHDEEYLEHLRTVHDDWVKEGCIESNESVLPECFPFAVSGQMPTRPPSDPFARTGFYAYDMSSGIAAGTYDSVRASAALASLAARTSKNGVPVIALTRPPGHHCLGNKAGGYCYVNNAVVALETWQVKDEEMTVFDLDFHHGNGTQEMLYARKVRYISIHDPAEYPYYSGSQEERGIGDGLGWNHNIELPKYAGREKYLVALDQAIACITGDHLVISLGFDTLRGDPLGHMDLVESDYFEIGRRVAQRCKAMKVVILLEGGYNVLQLGQCLEQFCDGWES